MSEKSSIFNDDEYRSIAMGFLAGGTYVLAVSFGVFVLGIVVAYGLYYLDNKYGISKSLIE
ncbi:hypothetical protein XBKQ1_790001 [Xenorhabdus bovienii str. kraussei Quebec]|uniref:Uncharacterized protein n=1 Tax=Xenorhabdus bovienii str. kraussei Quebec TaxID=1398203 RepID=A0A077PMT6_XENBV|nr:hypothetical protein [Xenorhabdus bovienii]CDH21887.1 hypothetical protein XBKQ1_790001 [Xenorhabdus bovienii str. kraussei Quebec]